MLGQTLTQKIISKASGRDYVNSGELVWVDVDILMSHDPCTPGIFSVFEKEFGATADIWDSNKIVLIPDHFTFSADESANSNIRVMREIAKKYKIKNFYDINGLGYKGVCHIALAEGKHAIPNQILVGTDSHTVTSGAFGAFAIGVGITDAAFILGTGKMLVKVPKTIRVDFIGELPIHVQAKDLILKLIGEIGVNGATYKTIEFGGNVIENLSIEERMTICNMVVECGAKNGIMIADTKVFNYLKDNLPSNFSVMYPDINACYDESYTIDVSGMSSIVAKPHSPDNIDMVEYIEGTPIDRAYIGSCTGGKIEDFISVAKIIYGRKVVIPTFAVPATKYVFQELITRKIFGKSIYEILLEAGVLISSDTSCAACCGGPADTFGRANDKLNIISTTNRNFIGRMGDKRASVYLGSPYTVAATAIYGYIKNPASLVNSLNNYER